MKQPVSARIVPSSDRLAWQTALDSVGGYDVYHLAEYQDLAASDGELPRLIVVEAGEWVGVVPLLLRPLRALVWYDQDGFDAVSAYGYPGPLLSTSQSDAVSQFENQIRQALSSAGVVSAFIRSHPLMTPADLFPDDCLKATTVVFLDTTLSSDQQLLSMRKTHRYELRKARTADIEVSQDVHFSTIETFIELYNRRMQQLGATNDYFFPRSYYEKITKLPDGACMLFNAIADKEIVAAALFLVSDQGVQYHLSASDSSYSGPSPIRIIIDEARIWASQRRKRWLHLGGGAGGNEDSLLRFKRGFSRQEAAYRTFGLIVDSPTYEKLAEYEQAWATDHGLPADHISYFPQYRRPRPRR